MDIYFCPAWLLDWLGSRGLPDCLPNSTKRIHFGYFLSNLAVVALLPLAHLAPHYCLMQVLTGIPCPGCGVTHALLLALTLRFRESLMANPAGLAIAANIGFQLCGRPVAILVERASELVGRTSRWLASVSVVLLLAAWVFNLIKPAA